jgi:hypothetical protein
MTRRPCFQSGTGSSRVPGIHRYSFLVSKIHNSSGGRGERGINLTRRRERGIGGEGLEGEGLEGGIGDGGLGK